MDEWYTVVRNLRDESTNPYLTEQFCHHVFHDIQRMRIKDKSKFSRREGQEFGVWSLGLESTFPHSLVTEILNDDIFWTTTIKLIWKTNQY